MATTRALFAGDDPTPDSVKRRRALAAELLRKGADTSHIDHPLEAIGSVMQSWAGYLNQSRADADEKAGMALRQKAWNDTADRVYSQSWAVPGMASGAAGAATGGTAPSSSSASPIVPTGDIETSFLNTVKGGISNPYGLAAVAATGRAESGYDAKNAFGSWADPSESGQAGTAGGIMSWRAERLAGLQDFARRAGDDPNRPSPETQAQFFLQEDPALVERLNSAGSLEEAQSAINGAWRFAGYDRPGGEADRRLGLARGYLSSLQGDGGQQPVQVASLDPSAGMGGSAFAPADAFDWTPYATAGATREDSFSGMTPQFRGGLQALVQNAPPELGLQIGSGYRSVERQRELWEQSDKTGRTVARPGHSQHNHGNAADLYAGGQRLDKASPAARQWVHENAGRFGLTFPMDYEPWHVELAGARGGKNDGAVSSAPVQVASLDPTAGMAMAYAPQQMERPGIELGTGTVDVPNPFQSPGPSPVQTVAPTPIASQEYDLPPIPTPAPVDARQALSAQLLRSIPGAGDLRPSLGQQDAVAALGDEEPAALRAARRARRGNPTPQALANALLADANGEQARTADSSSPSPSPSPEALGSALLADTGTGGTQARAPNSLYDRALIAQLLGNEWTEDLGQQLLSQEVQHRQWYARQQYEAQQAETERQNGLTDYEAKRVIDARFEKPAKSYETLTADEVQQLGLPAGVYQRGSDGNIDKVADAPASTQFRQATPDEAAGYGAAGGQFGPDGRFYPIDPPKGPGSGGIITLPDGTRVVTGGAALTEGQSKDTVYSTRARGALEILDKNAGALTDRGDRAAEWAPFGLGREYLQSTDFQVAQQAGDEFLQAILRKDTGAAITEQEQMLYGRTYLPQPGDSPELQAQKQQSRVRAVAAIEAGMPPAAIVAQELALREGAENAVGDAGTAAPPTDNDPLGLR